MNKCKDCIHNEACLAWMRHCLTLYDDFEYSVENCPFFEAQYAKIMNRNISTTGFICSSCCSSIDEDSLFCKYCGIRLDRSEINS